MKYVVTCRYVRYANAAQLKQISLIDKRLRGISLPLLFQRVCMKFVYKENVWKLATDTIEGMLASTAFDIVVGNTRCDS